MHENLLCGRNQHCPALRNRNTDRAREPRVGANFLEGSIVEFVGSDSSWSGAAGLADREDKVRADGLPRRGLAVGVGGYLGQGVAVKRVGEDYTVVGANNEGRRHDARRTEEDSTKSASKYTVQHDCDWGKMSVW